MNMARIELQAVHLITCSCNILKQYVLDSDPNNVGEKNYEVTTFTLCENVKPTDACIRTLSDISCYSYFTKWTAFQKLSTHLWHATPTRTYRRLSYIKNPHMLNLNHICSFSRTRAPHIYIMHMPIYFQNVNTLLLMIMHFPAAQRGYIVFIRN